MPGPNFGILEAPDPPMAGPKSALKSRVPGTCGVAQSHQRFCQEWGMVSEVTRFN